MTILKVVSLLLLTSVVSACSVFKSPTPIDIVTVEAPRPELVVPDTDNLKTRNVEWVVITPDNVEQVFKDLEERGMSIVLFAITDEGYENLSLNFADTLKLIQQQKSIIAAYQRYYEAEEQ